jgi:hypothetical protein
MNGILKEMTAWDQWIQAGGTLAITYDSSFSTSVSGYPKGAVLASTTAGKYWLNTADGNTVNPDGAGTNWVDFFAPLLRLTGGTMTGSLVHCAGTTTVAPMAFQGGVLLTTAVVNAFECDGARLYYTTAGPTRNTIAYTTDAAPSAAKWTTARTLSLTGPVTASAAVDGHADVAFATTITAGSVGTSQLASGAVTTAKVASNAITTALMATTGVTAASYTYASITVGVDGRITAASSGTAPVFGTAFASTGNSISGTSVAAAHGLSGVPSLFAVQLICASAEFGYSVGDAVNMPEVSYTQGGGGTGAWFSVNADATNVTFSWSDITRISIGQKGGGTPGPSPNVNGYITAAKWTVTLRAWL